MARPNPPSTTDEAPQGDPWHAFGYLTSGVLVYGMAGWALDRWLGTSFLVVIGVLFGAVLGLYLTWMRFRPRDVDETAPKRQSS
jgi:F0F1-type ATP synthase assembly protein I